MLICISFHNIMIAKKMDCPGGQKKNESIYYAQIYRQNQGDSEDIEIQYQIEKIQSHRFKKNGQSELSQRHLELLQMPLAKIPDCELQFLVKWIGHQERSWQPGQNLKNAPQILETYKRYYQQRKLMSTTRTYTGKTRGRKPKNASANTNANDKPAPSKGRQFNFNKVYRKKTENIKEQDEDDDEILIIDKQTYIKGTKEFSQSLVVENFKRQVHEQKNIEEIGMAQRSSLNQSFLSQNIEILSFANIEGHISQMPVQKNGLQHQAERQKIDQINQKNELQSKSNHLQLPNINEIHNSTNHIEHKQCLEAFQANQIGDPIQVTELNERSVMITQEQKLLLQNQKKQIPKPLCENSEQRNPERYKNIQPSSLSAEDRLIDLFIETEKKHPHNSQYQECPQIQTEKIYWPEDQRFSVEKQHNIGEMCAEIQYQNEKNINEQQISKNPFALFNNEQDEQNVILPKRMLSKQDHVEEEGQVLTKKIKVDQNMPAEPLLKQYTLFNHKNSKKPIQIIDLQEDQLPSECSKQLNKHEPLKQRIEKEVHHLLNQDQLNIEDIINDKASKQSLPKATLKAKETFKVEKRSCTGCQRHEQYNYQLRLLFNELIQSSQEIYLDDLFLEQETFSVLNTLNPHYYSQSSQKYIRIDKMADITGKDPLCTLMLRKIAKAEEIQGIIKDFKLSKLIKIKDEWFGIFRAESLGERKHEHFKYVKANNILQHSKETIVSFLIN